MKSAEEIAEALEEYAVLLEFHGENQFKIKAFRTAASVIREHADSFGSFLEQAYSGSVSGIGRQLCQVLKEIEERGDFESLITLRSSSPEDLPQLLKLPGLGVKKLRSLFTELHIRTVEDLERACREGTISRVKGFGEKTQTQILSGIEEIRGYAGYYLYLHAQSLAEELRTAISALRLGKRVEIAGSLRRKNEVVRNINLLLEGGSVEETYADLERAGNLRKSATEHQGYVTSHRRIPVIIQATDLAFEALLLYRTGARPHIERLERLAAEAGLRLTPQGLFKGDECIAVSELEIYRQLGLAFIPPELREGRGEIEIAQANPSAFVNLVREQDLRGILHVHSTYSDGINSLAELANAAKQAGYAYLGVTDHSRSSVYANGLSIERVQAQQQEIDRLNAGLAPFRIFKGIEVDILADGSLDYPPDVLATFDFTIASVHSYLTMASAEMTGRLLKAIRDPFTTIIGHSTGRLLLERAGARMDTLTILKAAADEGVAMEINANPLRLDLDWRYLSEAKSLGVKMPICPDAHTTRSFVDVRFGVGIARKGGLAKEDIPNCWELARIEEFFRGRRSNQ